MQKCSRCKGKLLIDRQYSSLSHLEIFCINCGFRKFFHPPTESAEGTWLLKREVLRAKATISPL